MASEVIELSLGGRDPGREGRSERASDAQCIAPSCFTRKAGIRAKEGGRQAGRKTGREVGP